MRWQFKSGKKVWRTTDAIRSYEFTLQLKRQKKSCFFKFLADETWKRATFCGLWFFEMKSTFQEKSEFSSKKWISHVLESKPPKLEAILISRPRPSLTLIKSEFCWLSNKQLYLTVMSWKRTVIIKAEISYFKRIEQILLIWQWQMIDKIDKQHVMRNAYLEKAIT